MGSINASTTNVLGYTQFDPVPNYQVDGQTQFFDTSNPILNKGDGWFILFGRHKCYRAWLVAM